MEDERTFGVEIELTSRVERHILSEIINRAFHQADSLHSAISTGYIRNADGRNFLNWTIKTDGSIRTGVHDGYIHGAEIVSPVLRGEAGLEQLKIVCEAIKNYVKVNKSCGLHVHHGMLPQDKLGNILMAWVRAERLIYECLPVSRKTGSYSVPVSSRVSNLDANVPNNRSEFKRWTERNLYGRYWGLNPASLWIRNTFEVRCAAGTHEFTKIANWIRVTQRLISKGSAAPDHFRNLNTIRDLTDTLTTALDLPERTELVQRAVEVVARGQAQWLPRRTTRSGYAFYRLLESPELISRRELVRECRDRFGSTTTQAEIYVSDAINILARRAALRVIRLSNGQRLRITYPETITSTPTTETMVHPAVRLDAANTPADQDAFLWLRKRHEKFAPLHQAGGC